MTFLGLFKREIEDNELSSLARLLVGEVRNGASEDDAAKASDIDPETLREWRRNPAYRFAVRRARAQGPYEPACHNLNAIAAELDDPSAPPPPGTPDYQIEAAGWQVIA
ncbi:MAG: hypothetical protein ABSG93_18945 [Solirubrobacteraceae bacterium]